MIANEIENVKKCFKLNKKDDIYRITPYNFKWYNIFEKKKKIEEEESRKAKREDKIKFSTRILIVMAENDYICSHRLSLSDDFRKKKMIISHLSFLFCMAVCVCACVFVRQFSFSSFLHHHRHYFFFFYIIYIFVIFVVRCTKFLPHLFCFVIS